MAKSSTSARVFCGVVGTLFLAAGGLGGYVGWVNKHVADLARQQPAPHVLADLPKLTQPAYVRLSGVVAGEPVLIHLSKPPADPKEADKKLPPKMNVWVPLYASKADQQANRIAAIYAMRGVPLAAKATLPTVWDGLIAEGAFGMLRSTPPAPFAAEVPVLTQPSENLNVTYLLPAIGAGVAFLVALSCFASIPWANWEMPKLGSRRKVVRVPQPLRGLPAEATLYSSHARTTGRWLSASMCFLLPGLLLLGMGVLFIGLMIREGSMGQTGGFLVLFAVVGVALIIAGLVRSSSHSLRVDLHDGGLRWEEGKAERAAAWEDIVEVYRTEERTTYQSAFTTRESLMRLVFCDESELKFDHSLADYDELSQAILFRASACLSERKAAELTAGGADFGPILLTPDGVRHDNGSLQPWNTLLGYTVENGRFWFRTSGMNLLARTYEVKNIPNLPVLIEMLDSRFDETRRMTDAFRSTPDRAGSRRNG